MSAIVRNESTNFTSKIYDRLRSIAIGIGEQIASTSIGQTLLKYSDNVLWIIEKSASWFTPPEPGLADSNNRKQTETRVIRPLPWVLFIPMLLFLRISKASINVGMFLLGLEPVQAASVIKFLHSQRRKIRSMRLFGLRKLQEQKVNASSIQTDQGGRNWKEQLTNKLLNTFCLSRTSYEQIKQSETELFIYKEKVQKDRNEEISSPESNDYEPILDKNVIDKLRTFAYAQSNTDTDPDCKNEESLTEDSMSEEENNKSTNNYTEKNDSNNETKHTTKENINILTTTTKTSVENFIETKEAKNIICEKNKTENKQVCNTNNVHKTDECKLNDLDTLSEKSNVKETSDVLSQNNSGRGENSSNVSKLLNYNESSPKDSEINCNTEESMYNVLKNSTSDDQMFSSISASVRETTSKFMEEMKKVSLHTTNKSNSSFPDTSPRSSSKKSDVKEENIRAEDNESNTGKNADSSSTDSFRDEKVSYLLESTLKNKADVDVDISKEVLTGKNKLNNKPKYYKRKGVHRLNNKRK